LKTLQKNGQKSARRWGEKFLSCLPDELKIMKRQASVAVAAAGLQRAGSQSGMVPETKKGGKDGKVSVAGSSVVTPEADTPNALSFKSGITGAESVDEDPEEVGQEVGPAAHTLPWSSRCAYSLDLGQCVDGVFCCDVPASLLCHRRHIPSVRKN
jgi:hypothetical protein